MGRGILIVACATAACSSTGVDLQIEVQHATRVEVFVASHWCKDDLGNPCASGVGWSSSVAAPPNGQIYLLADDRMIEAIAKDGYFDVQLQAERDYREPLAIALVGYDDAGTVVEANVLRGVEIPRNHAETWKIKLEPVDPASEDVTSHPGAYTRARSWQRPADSNAGWPSCLAYQSWKDSTWATEYFVPPGDRDCDAQQVECSQYWVDDGNVAVTPVLCNAGPDVPGTCTLGSSRCAAVGKACTSGSICLPDVVCATCADRPTDDCLSNLLGSSLPDLTPVPRARCEFSTSGSQWCASADKIVLPARGAKCTAARMRLPGSAFTGGVTTQTFQFNVTVKIAAVANNVTGSCEVHVTATDGATAAFTGFQENVLLAVDYDNGRQIVIPLVLGFERQFCPTYQPCALLGDDNDPVYACAAFP